MNFPRFWAKATHGDFACWRWANPSLAEAQAPALDAARKAMERFGGSGAPPGHYGYSDRPLREQVLREVGSQQGEMVAVVTRNAHGCLVLNV